MTLIFAANHIGNVADIPSRSLKALQESDVVIFEEDRVARQTLKAAGIHREYRKLNEHDKELNEEIQEALLQNKTVLYMSDQGMPNLADPGQKLLVFAYANGIRVQVIPGPSSISAALAAFPQSTEQLIYAGFLPRDDRNRKHALLEFKKSKGPIVILDTPYRLAALLESCIAAFGGQRQALLALDISGPDEDFVFEKLAYLLELGKNIKLNFVLIITAG